MRVLPRSLAARTAVVLIVGFMLVQALGLTIHALDRIELQRLAEARDLGGRVSMLYRTVMAGPPENWAGLAHDLNAGSGLQLSIDAQPPRDELKPAPPDIQEMVRTYSRFGPVTPPLRPRDINIRGGDGDGQLLLSLRLADDRWFVARAVLAGAAALALPVLPDRVPGYDGAGEPADRLGGKAADGAGAAAGRGC